MNSSFAAKSMSSMNNNVNFMTPEQLMRVLADSSSQKVGGDININGMSIKLIKNNNEGGHQR